MSANLELRWLKVDELTGAARRFADFSKEDINTQGKEESFDLKKYEDSVKLVLCKLDSSLLHKKLFNPDLKNKVTSESNKNLEKNKQSTDVIKEKEIEETSHAN